MAQAMGTLAWYTHPSMMLLGWPSISAQAQKWPRSTLQVPSTLYPFTPMITTSSVWNGKPGIDWPAVTLWFATCSCPFQQLRRCSGKCPIILHYFDDFLVLGPSGSGMCKAALDSALSTCQSRVADCSLKNAWPMGEVSLPTVCMYVRTPRTNLASYTSKLTTWLLVSLSVYYPCTCYTIMRWVNDMLYNYSIHTPRYTISALYNHINLPSIGLTCCRLGAMSYCVTLEEVATKHYIGVA